MSQASPPPRGFLGQLQFAQLVLAACALVVMSLVTVADVLLRYLLNRPVRGSYDLVECALVVFVFHGIATVFLDRKNIVIDVIDGIASAGLRTALIRISDVLQIAVLALFAWAMLSPARQAFDYGDRKLELGLPVYVIWLFALAGIAGTIVCAIGALVRTPIPPPGVRSA
jgi:TRAP-type C4-dicarboxylate transport system permease small subunit